MKKAALIMLLFFMAFAPAFSKRLYKEADYVKTYCFKTGGIIEYKNNDNTRVDCLTENNAIEFDFANKWAEGVGQALYYGMMTGKKGKVILILENPEKEIIYYKRVEKLSKIYNFDTGFITPSIFEQNFPALRRCKDERPQRQSISP